MPPRLSSLASTPDAIDFVLRVKKEALGPYIVERWGWDETLQRTQLAEGWRARDVYAISIEGERAGVLSLHRAGDVIWLHELYLLPAYHRRGIGGQVLGAVLREGVERRVPVRLRCIKWNPAAAFYRRHGFSTVEETDTHYVMEHRCREGTIA